MPRNALRHLPFQNAWPKTTTEADDARRPHRRRSSKRCGDHSGSAEVVRLPVRARKESAGECDRSSFPVSAEVIVLPRARNLRAEVEQAFREAKFGRT